MSKIEQLNAILRSNFPCFKEHLMVKIELEMGSLNELNFCRFIARNYSVESGGYVECIDDAKNGLWITILGVKIVGI